MLPNEFVIARIKAIQKELEDLKKAVTNTPVSSAGELKIEGLWKGLRVDEEDFHDAARSVFKGLDMNGKK